MGARWTEEEDEIVREVWFMPGALKVHTNRFVGRTVQAIKSRGGTLGLPHREKKLYSSNFSWVKDSALRALEHGPMHSIQIGRRIRASIGKTQDVLNQLRGNGIYIYGWTRIAENGTGPLSPIWARGDEPDAPKPEKMSGKERMRVWREKKKKKPKNNPFAAAAGLVVVPSGKSGRVYRQPMDVDDCQQSKKAA